MSWKKDYRKRLNTQSYAEKLVTKMLGKHGINFRRNAYMRTACGTDRFLDFKLKQYGLLIEIDGMEPEVERKAP